MNRVVAVERMRRAKNRSGNKRQLADELVCIFFFRYTSSSSGNVMRLMS